MRHRVRVDRDEVLVTSATSPRASSWSRVFDQALDRPRRRGAARRPGGRPRPHEEDAEGRLILSKKRARFEMAWKRIEAAAESGSLVEGTVIEVVKGGLILDPRVRGSPASPSTSGASRTLDEFMGKTLRTKVIELNPIAQQRRPLAPRRARGGAQGGAPGDPRPARPATSPGDDLEHRRLRRLRRPGRIDGLIHISELSWSRWSTCPRCSTSARRSRSRCSTSTATASGSRSASRRRLIRGSRWSTYSEGDVVEGRVRRWPRSAPSSRSSQASRASCTFRACEPPHREPARGREPGRRPFAQGDRDRRRPAPPLAVAQAGRRRRGRTRADASALELSDEMFTETAADETPAEAEAEPSPSRRPRS